MSFQIKWSLIFKGLKFLSIIAILAFLGYAGYLAYYFATNQPYEVRVTNVTGSSATVSWYTKRKDMGVVAYKPVDSFISPLAWFGATLAYDDRDVALAQTELADKAAQEAAKSVDINYEITLSEEDLNNLKVIKKGKYYVHHVTLNNLEAEKQYYFRVGNGLFWWNAKSDNQKYEEHEAPTVDSLEFKTNKDREDLKSPDPVYGKVISLSKDKYGFLTENLSTDAIVFLNVWKKSEDSFSLYQSSVTNLVGGWVIDKSNIVDPSGDFNKEYTKGEDKLYIYAQFENLPNTEFKELTWGVDDAPADDIRIANDVKARVKGGLLDVLKLSIKNVNLGRSLSGIAYKSYAIECKVGYKQVAFGCVKDTTQVVHPSIPTTPSNNSDKEFECPPGKERKNGKCVEINGGCPDGMVPRAGGCILAPVSDGGASPSLNPTLQQSEPNCPNNNVITLSDGRKICGSTNNATLSARTDLECVGEYANSCEPETGCYCKWQPKDKTIKDSIDYGHGRLDGVNCRPAACGSIRNGDYLSDGKTPRLNAGGFLCGADVTSQGCFLDKPSILVNGKVVCGTNYVKDAEGNCVVKTGVSDPSVNGSITPQTCTGEGKAFNTATNECGCMPGWSEVELRGQGKKCINENLPPAPNVGNGNCKVFKTDITLNCGSRLSSKLPFEKKCFDSEDPKIIANKGCGIGDYCAYAGGYASAGICLPKGDVVTIDNETTLLTPYVCNGNECKPGVNNNTSELGYDCYVSVDDKGVVDEIVITNKDIEDRKVKKAGNTWIQSSTAACLANNKTNVDSLNNSRNRLIPLVNAKSNVSLESEGNFLAIFPESGTYDIKVGNQSYKNVYINKDNKYFFYDNRDGKDGYQSPIDPANPKFNEDLLLPVSGAQVTLYDKSSNQSLKLNKGINIVAFNFVPSRLEGKNMNARQLMRILNSSGVKVTRITTFEGGKWAGGLVFNEKSNEIIGNDFVVTPGKGYLLVSNSTYTATVPGYGIKNSIPVALSSGWNLIGVNGFKKTYTASTLIDSINEIEGVGSNNVTWWPTSKGRYDTFQKSEGVEYGFDFPILKDIGYFVRVNEFDRKGDKSVIWNPGGQLHGEAGSNK